MKKYIYSFLVALLWRNAHGQGQYYCNSTGMLPYDYQQVICQSFLFYEVQRSGALPDDQRAFWRGDSAMDDGSDNGVDLTGGYYDAGDHVKFGFPMAFTATSLSWGILAYESAYTNTGQLDYARKTVQWATDYFLKAHTGYWELYGQVGDGELDHAYWGPPENMTMPRPSKKIDANCGGTELAAETAAALAAASMIFQTVDSAYASNLLSSAIELFEFADSVRRTYTDCIPGAIGFYDSWSGYGDELAWGSTWLYLATGDVTYLDRAKGFVNEFSLFWGEEFSWDNKVPGVYALLAEIEGSGFFTDSLQDYLYKIRNEIERTPLGLVYLDSWGSLRHAANVAFVALRGADLGIDSVENENFSFEQANYILGSTGRSFIVGFGVDPPQRPHHRSSSCPHYTQSCEDPIYQYGDEPNVWTLYGGLVGGPDSNDYYEDNRNDYEKNEVACDFNALFTGLMAGLATRS